MSTEIGTETEPNPFDAEQHARAHALRTARSVLAGRTIGGMTAVESGPLIRVAQWIVTGTDPEGTPWASEALHPQEARPIPHDPSACVLCAERVATQK